MYAKPHFTMLAHYNRWAGERLFDAADALSPEEQRADRGAFFGSITGTLNHILVTDEMWLARVHGEPPPPYVLYTIVTEDLAELRERHAGNAQRFIGLIGGLTPADYERVIRYRRVSDTQEIAQPLAGALSHVFNHQTHHRGQVHAMITAARGRDAGPVLDLLVFQRETGHGM